MHRAAEEAGALTVVVAVVVAAEEADGVRLRVEAEDAVDLFAESERIR